MLYRNAVIGLVVLLAGSPVWSQETKTTMGLMDLNCSGISREEGLLLSDRLLSELAKLPAFDIVERDKRDEILREQGFSLSGTCDQTSCLVEVGKYLAVQKMVGGSIGKFGNSWTINIRRIDVSTGKVEQTYIEDYRGAVEDLLGKAEKIARTMATTVVPADNSGRMPQSTGAPVRGGSLKHPRLAWSTAGLAGFSGVVALYCALEANKSYDAYKTSASVADMDYWKDRTKTYDGLTYISGGMVPLFAGAATYLFLQRQDAVRIGFEVNPGGAGSRYRILLTGKF